ncbi:helix-turn-helix domain-containing protein [Methylomonas rhizoryzae]|uniref:helix-turn-helix domain-containing protein n=1 Tax=Methylomonas rhizoryzae TaxID=2608981 RepID=UPI0016807A4E|nr:helix-turn-helix transcriptional regulator [Methylomonas rhizoryzae]
MNSAAGDETSLIGVTIEYQAPLTLLILRALKPFPLSAAQRQIAQWLAQGFSFEQIGCKQHIKASTVKDHVHAIYTKLGVRNRDEILPRLISYGGFRDDGTQLN